MGCRRSCASSAKVGHALVVLPAVTGLVLDDRGRVLLIRHARSGQWDLPAGAIEPDETPEDAVVRELREETGLIVEPVALVGVGGGPEFRVEYPNGDVVSYVSTIFECRVVGGRLRPDGAEALDARFFPLPELTNLDLARISRAKLRIAMNDARFADRLSEASQAASRSSS